MQTQNFYPQDISLSKQKTAQISAAGSFELFRSGAFGFLLLFLFSVLAGCGTGGYIGGGISSLSASAVTIDSGQGFAVSSTVSGGLPVSWGLACTTSSCGTVSQNTGTSTVYTSPSGLSAQLKVTLTASVAGTQSKQTVSITVNPDPVISGTPPAGVVGTPYTATLVASGGTGTLKLSQASGSLPAGLTFNAATGVISGTPTTTGTSTFIAQVTDSSDVPLTVTASETIVITSTATTAQLSLSGTPPAGTVGSAYATTLIGAGGTAPYSFSVLSGSLPAGLSLSASTGAITGVPTVAGTSSFTAQVQDASGLKATAIFSIPIANAGGTISLTTSMLPNGTVGVPYSATIGVTGGTAPYTCAFTAGTLPAGLSLNGCVVSGTPTAAGTASLTVKATDSGNPVATTSGPETITIASAGTLIIGSPAGGTVGVPYTGLIPITGGTAPYSCILTSGTLPAGLTLSGCTVTGTPITAGTATVTIKATDSGNPPTVTSGTVTITIAPAPLAITTGTLPNGTVGVVYSSTIGVSGGTSPYNCTITAGTLPAGLTLGANCLVSGTPTTAGTSPLTVMATDSSNPTLSTTGPVSVTIVAAPALIITSPPGGMVGTPYTGSVPVSGGTAPYTCSVSSGTLPAGLSFGSGCAITGTPITAGTSTLTVKVTDSKSPVTTSTGTITVVISPSALTITTGTLPNGTVGVTYSSTIGVSGGTSPYACSITSGTLPAGLTLGANCLVSGIPTVATTANLTVKATDSSNPTVTTTGPVSITINPAVVLTLGNPPPGTVGQPYTGTIPVTGGTGPYTCSVTNGSLPQGLSLSGCTITGTPIIGVVDPVTISVTDSGKPPSTGTGPVTITINNAPLAITTGTLPNGTVGVTYSSTIGVTGGTSPYACTITSGTLPAGLTLGANCLVSGTPTVATTANLTVKATDSSNPAVTTTGPVSITINPAPLAITTGTLPNGTVGVTYSSTIGVTGGTSPYSCSITSGTLPAGLTLGANCLVSGTPTVATTANLTVKATDSSNPAVTTTGPVSITINPAPLAITTGTLPNGTVGVTYSSTIGVTGGTAPYACTITSGTLPAGLTLGANCLVSGTPTVATTANLMVKATDSSNPAVTTTGPVSITINPAPLAITTGTLPNGTVGVTYSSTIGVTGGTAPYACTITSGTLPAGLTLGANCLVSGTPTVATTANLTVKATDSSNPAITTTGPVSITINPAPLAITTGTLPNGTVGVTYSSTIGVTGGTSPYACTITSGTLPAGLTLGANCLVSGTPTVATTANLTVKATDSSNPAVTTTGPVSVTINPAPVAITTGTLPNGTVGVTYSSTIGVTGGTSPYACTITSGTLPAGLTLGANCLVSGTPTVATTANLTVKATDSSNPTLTTTGPVSITINPGIVLTLGNPPPGTVGQPYMGTIPVTGGTGPYTCSVTNGSLPQGLSLSGCVITGTPVMGTIDTVTVTVTDSGKPPSTGTGPVTITINNTNPTLTLSNPPVATVGTPYTGIIPVSGGTGPYTCTLNSGTVPAGLTLNNCTLTGTPTIAITATLNITATDASNPQGTVTSPVVVTVNPVPALTFTGSLPNGVVGVPYTQTLAATGGIAPYTYAVTAGTLNPGLSLNATTGVISGTPTTPGAMSFTVTATDSENPNKTANLPLVLLITYPVTVTDSELKGPYAFLFQGYDDVAVGLFAYQTATAGSFTADGAGALTNGELDANHQIYQGSNPASTTITSNLFLGTYTLGADNRGSLTITTLNADGTTARTFTYAITVKAPVAPATTTAQASMIEFDGDQVAGTKGSGSILQQTAASFSTGLTGSYAFGLGGDTPCLPTCTIGIVAGPVASVGQFTAAAGAVSGFSDANIANIKYTNQPLSGSYGAADGNGRVQLSLATAGTPTGIYPTDYAVYMVDANHAFVLSTDKHSAAILLAGTAQSQTLATYANTSLNGPFIGYENAATNPGLVGATLANTINLSTATIFRATSDGAGTCAVTNVDTGGVTQLVNGLTGLGSGAPTINALLGTYQSTGAAACSIGSNGRGILNYPVPNTVLTGALGLLGITAVPPPARVVYLASPDRGYFLETGYAGLGQIEPQTGAPFTQGVGIFNGTYLYGEAPASSVATINASGFITAKGNGTATSDQDLNVGVGTVNILQLGVLHNDTYTAPDQTSGRFLLNDTTVIDQSAVYVISPGRFVLLDLNPATTSPSVNVLY